MDSREKVQADFREKGNETLPEAFKRPPEGQAEDSRRDTGEIAEDGLRHHGGLPQRNQRDTGELPEG